MTPINFNSISQKANWEKLCAQLNNIFDPQLNEKFMAELTIKDKIFNEALTGNANVIANAKLELTNINFSVCTAYQLQTIEEIKQKLTDLKASFLENSL